jgi:NAD(P)-dependent dehydrogenase (short-subunit alcohol dehydrogenase family)
MPENQFQEVPGHQHKLDPQPASNQVPGPDGSYSLYKAAGKLSGKRAMITGGDSGIGRATAVLFAMEGADSFITYLPEEEKDAQQTKKEVEEHGRKCHLHAADLRSRDNCVKAVEEAVKALGGLDILFNNHAFQMVQENILSLPDEQWLKTFDTNVHRTSCPPP